MPKSVNQKRIELLERLYGDDSYRKPVMSLHYEVVDASKAGGNKPLKVNAYELTHCDLSKSRIERAVEEPRHKFESRVDDALKDARQQHRQGQPIPIMMPCHWLPS